MKEQNAINYQGASKEAIQHHYDAGNAFYRLWLDASMTYSAALWQDGDDLTAAQLRKMDYHANNLKLGGQSRVLDIGCGWGSMAKHLLEQHDAAEVVALTLSQEQANQVKRLDIPNLNVLLQSWADHQAEKPYDGIVSIGAFEHFAGYKQSEKEKITAYRQFFQNCYQWLKPQGRLSLQTIVYENADVQNINEFLSQAIFPESELPHLAEIIKASERLFEVVTIRNDRSHYEKTLRIWLKTLRKNRNEAVKLVGETKVAIYEKYFSLSMIGFHTGALNLSRITLQRLDNPIDLIV